MVHGSPTDVYYFLRCRIRARMRLFFRPIFRRPRPVFLTPTSGSSKMRKFYKPDLQDESSAVLETIPATVYRLNIRKGVISNLEEKSVTDAIRPDNPYTVASLEDATQIGPYNPNYLSNCIFWRLIRETNGSLHYRVGRG